MGDDIQFRGAGVPHDRIHKRNKIRDIQLRVGPALRGRRQLLRGRTVIRDCPEFLHRIPRVQESLLDTLPRFIPITGVAGIAVNKEHRAML